MADLEAKVRQLETQLKEKEVALRQVQCELIQTKQQLCSAEQQIITHKDYKVKLEQVLSNMQVQHELIVTKLTLAGQPIDSALLSQNKRRVELQEVFEGDPRTDTQIQSVVDKEEVVGQQDVQQCVSKGVLDTTQSESRQCPTLCQGDLEDELPPLLLVNGTAYPHKISSKGEVQPLCEQDDTENVYHTAVAYGSTCAYAMPGNESLQLWKDTQRVSIFRESNNNNTHTT